MELFLLYSMGLTIIAFFSIVMASPKVLPAAGHGPDSEPKVLTPNSAEEKPYNNPNQEAVPFEEPQEIPDGSATTDTANEEHSQFTEV